MTEESAPAKILIVEDEALIAREIRHRLTKMGLFGDVGKGLEACR